MVARKRKKNFLLVEVIIGLALFSLCALPLARQPFLLAQKSHARLFEAEIARQAEVAHCNVIADLHSGRIDWNSLPKKPRERLSLPNTPCEIHLGEKSQKYTQKAVIRLKSSKETTEQQEARLLELKITYSQPGRNKPYSFSYLLTALGPAPVSNPGYGSHL